MIEIPKNDSARIVKQALSFETPDRLPVFDSFWDEFVDNWRSMRGIGADVDIEDYFWVDLKVTSANETLFPTKMRQIKEEGEDVFMDDGWGRIIRTKPGTYFSDTVERIFNKPSDLDRIEFDPPTLDMRYSNLIEQVHLLRKKDKAVFVKIGGVFIRSSFFRGQTQFLMDIAMDEPLATAIAEKVGNHLLQIGLESLKRTNTYDTGVWIYDDMCNIRSPMFSPTIFERIFLPIYKRIVLQLKAAGARWVILHCDGNLKPLLDMITEAGFDGINPVERNAGLIVEDLLEKYYGKLSLIGGVCNTQILPNTDRDKIRMHIETIVESGQNGGLIIGTHSIGPDIPVQSYELYRSIVAKKGIYHRTPGESA